MVQAEVIEQGDEAVMEPGEEEADEEEEDQATVEENQHDETDIVTEMPETTTVPPHPRPQVFAEIIEEEIIEEETVEVGFVCLCTFEMSTSVNLNIFKIYLQLLTLFFKFCIAFY